MEDYKARGREAFDGLVDRLVETAETYNHWDIEDDGMGADDVRVYVLRSMGDDPVVVRNSIRDLAFELDGQDPEVDALAADLGVWAASCEVAAFDWENFGFELEDMYADVSDFADEVHGRLLSDPQPVLDQLAGVPDYMADGRNLDVLGDVVSALPADVDVDMSDWPDEALSAVRGLDVGRVMDQSVPASVGGQRVDEPVYWEVPDAGDGGGRSADDGWEFA